MAGDKVFWDVIGASCDPDQGEVEWQDALVEALAKLEPEEIVLFDRWFDDRTDALYSHDLWGAAYLINGGASDDGFYFFRCWLVGMGKKVYEAALADPDSLADVVDPPQECEAEIYNVAPLAWRRLGLPEEEFDERVEALGPRPERELAGEEWDFDDDGEVRRRFPCLAALYIEEYTDSSANPNLD